MTGYTLPNGGVFYGECGPMQGNEEAQEFLNNMLQVTGVTEIRGTISGMDDVLLGNNYSKDGITLKETYVFMNVDTPEFNPDGICSMSYEVIE